MSSKLSFTDINEWYTSLNTLRNKENISLGAISVPNLNQKQARATDINDYINKLNALRTNEYFKHADWININTVSSQDQIRSILKENINNEITNLNKVCAKYSVTSSNSTCKTSGNGTNSTFFQSSSCQTNSKSCQTNNTYDGGCKTESTCKTCSAGFSFQTAFKTFITNTSGNSTFSQSFDDKTSTNSTCNTNVTKTFSYNFSVVSGKTTISNSKSTP